MPAPAFPAPDVGCPAFLRRGKLPRILGPSVGSPAWAAGRYRVFWGPLQRPGPFEISLDLDQAHTAEKHLNSQHHVSTGTQKGLGSPEPAPSLACTFAESSRVR